MKFLIAFAVIAVACATEEIRGVRLPPPPAPEVASPDYLPLVAPASLFDGNVPTQNEDVIVKAEPVIVGDISAALVGDVQSEHLSVIVVDLPLEVAAFDAGEVRIEKHEPIMVGEIPNAENIEPKAQPEIVEAPIESVKVATPVIDIEAPIIVDNVRVFNPSMLPRYADPALRNLR